MKPLSEAPTRNRLLFWAALPPALALAGGAFSILGSSAPNHTAPPPVKLATSTRRHFPLEISHDPTEMGILSPGGFGCRKDRAAQLKPAACDRGADPQRVVPAPTWEGRRSNSGPASPLPSRRGSIRRMAPISAARFRSKSPVSALRERSYSGRTPMWKCGLSQRLNLPRRTLPGRKPRTSLPWKKGG
jgi:hypothetical protein